MAFLCVLSFLTYFDRQGITQVQGSIQRDLGVSDTQMGMIFAAFWFAYAVFEIPSGFLADRFGARGTLTRIVLAWSLFTALSGSAIGFWSLLTLRFLFGMGEAGAYPSMARIQAAWLPPRTRARAGGMLWLCARWGAAFAPLIFAKIILIRDSAPVRSAIGGTFLGQLAGWRFGFWVSGLLGVAWVLLFWPFFRDNPADKRSVNAAELDLIRAGRSPGEIPSTHRVPREIWRALFASPMLWAMGILYLCVSFGWSFSVSWLPRYMKDQHHVEYQKSAWSSGLPLFFGGLACLLGGMASDYLVKRTGRKRLFRAVFPVCGTLTAAAAMVSLRFVHSADQATAVLCIAFFALDIGQGANWASIVDIGGRYAGTALGLINMVGNMGNTVQPIVAPYIFNHLSYNALFLTYAASFIIAASMWLFIDPNRRFYQEPLPDPGALPAR
jgi:ACS family glucarate transporter-like MFS transporter